MEKKYFEMPVVNVQTVGRKDVIATSGEVPPTPDASITVDAGTGTGGVVVTDKDGGGTAF